MARQTSIQKNLLLNGIKTLMGVLFPLITFPYASRILGAEGIGKVNYANSIVSYFSLMAALGISTYAVREGARIRDDKEKFNRFAKEILTINLCTTALAYCLLFLFLCLPILNGYKRLLFIASIGIVFSTIGIEWLFIIEEEYSYITIRALLFQLVSLVLLFLLVKSRDDYEWYAALTVISSGGSAILNLWYSRRLVGWRQRGGRLELKRHFKPIFLIFGTSLASSIYMTMDTTMLGAMRGDSAVGVYTAAVKINAVVATLLGTISATILPRVSYYVGNGLQEEYRKLMKSSMDILFLIAFPISLGMICTSDILILLFSGEEFLAGVPAAQILSAKLLVGAVNRVLAYQVCTPYKMDREVLFATTGGAVFNLIANAVLIPLAGVVGAATATLGSELIVFALLMKHAKKVLNVRALYARAPVYGAVCLSFFAVRFAMGRLFDSSLAVLAATVLCSAGIYALVLLGLRDPYLAEIVRRGKGLLKQKQEQR